jgi:hypothetical protein
MPACSPAESMLGEGQVAHSYICQYVKHLHRNLEFTVSAFMRLAGGAPRPYFLRDSIPAAAPGPAG